KLPACRRLPRTAPLKVIDKLAACRTFSQEDCMPGMQVFARIMLRFCLLALMAIQARPQGTLLTEEVEVCGYKTVSLKKIKQQIRTQPGKPFSEEQANRDFERLMGMGAFDGQKSKLIVVDGARGGKVVRFELEEIHKNK